MKYTMDPSISILPSLFSTHSSMYSCVLQIAMFYKNIIIKGTHWIRDAGNEAGHFQKAQVRQTRVRKYPREQEARERWRQERCTAKHHVAHLA